MSPRECPPRIRWANSPQSLSVGTLSLFVQLIVSSDVKGHYLVLSDRVRGTLTASLRGAARPRLALPCFRLPPGTLAPRPLTVARPAPTHAKHRNRRTWPRDAPLDTQKPRISWGAVDFTRPSPGDSWDTFRPPPPKPAAPPAPPFPQRNGSLLHCLARPRAVGRDQVRPPVGRPSDGQSWPHRVPHAPCSPRGGIREIRDSAPYLRRYIPVPMSQSAPDPPGAGIVAVVIRSRWWRESLTLLPRRASLRRTVSRAKSGFAPATAGSRQVRDRAGDWGAPEAGPPPAANPLATALRAPLAHRWPDPGARKRPLPYPPAGPLRPRRPRGLRVRPVHFLRRPVALRAGDEEGPQALLGPLPLRQVTPRTGHSDPGPTAGDVRGPTRAPRQGPPGARARVGRASRGTARPRCSPPRVAACHTHPATPPPHRTQLQGRQLRPRAPQGRGPLSPGQVQRLPAEVRGAGHRAPQGRGAQVRRDAQVRGAQVRGA